MLHCFFVYRKWYQLPVEDGSGEDCLPSLWLPHWPVEMGRVQWKHSSRWVQLWLVVPQVGGIYLQNKTFAFLLNFRWEDQYMFSRSGATVSFLWGCAYVHPMNLSPIFPLCLLCFWSPPSPEGIELCLINANLCLLCKLLFGAEPVVCSAF